MDETRPGPIIAAASRRRLLAGAGAAALAAPLVLRHGRAEAASNNLVFVTWGGSYRATLEEGIVKPFTAETGIAVTVVDTPDFAKVKAQQTTGNVEWDVFDALGAQATAGSKAGYWEPLGPNLFDSADLWLPAEKDFVPLLTFAGGIAYDPKRFAAGKFPRTFAEYFDTKQFPGRRTLRNRPNETLEAALLADGVPPSKVYPLDLDRAFRVLEGIKPHIVKWIDSTPQTISLLQTREADFSYSYASRVKTTNVAGAELGFSFDQTINGSQHLAVLRNAPNKENAMRFVSYALRPERQAAVMELQGNIPTSKKAMTLLSADTRTWLPNMESDKNLVLNDWWWSDHLDVVNRRFKEWVLS